MDDLIKEAFYKVKNDITLLYNQLNFAKENINTLKNSLVDISSVLEKIVTPIKEIPGLISTINEINSKLDKVLSFSVPTHTFPELVPSTHIPTHNIYSEASKPLNLAFSTGNDGVPTDKQTNRQTDNLPQKSPILDKKSSSIDNAAELLDSLDIIKKELRLKSKKLTEQELIVFSTIYTLEEELSENEYLDYKKIALKLNLTESSIRDYVGRLIKKDIPINKSKVNNKLISLSISPNLKKIASLNTLLRLRDL